MAARAGLLSYRAALDLVLDNARPLGNADVPLESLLGLTLAEPAHAAHPMPFFDNSAVDGYALTEEDAARTGEFALPVSGTMRAGADPTGMSMSPGATFKVLTGAAVPHGTATMVMQEDVSANGESVVFHGPLPLDRHIRRCGEEFQPGDEMIPAGTLATSAVIAALAASGSTSARAYRRPRMGILVTGDELLPPGAPLMPGRIYESNSHGLCAALQALGFSRPELRRVADSPEETRAALSDLLQCCDVVLTSGGVSVGEFDAIKPALAALDVAEIFWGVAIKPGKPFYFGRRHDGVVFGLPGNPVAAMVTFHALVKPYLMAVMGRCGEPRVRQATLARTLNKKPGRLEFVPCRLVEGVADPEVKRGSHMLGGFAGADALVMIPADETTVAEGDTVDVLPLEGGIF